jgi:hypothetical protein
MSKEPKTEPTTVTVDRAVFLDVAGSAVAALILAQATYTALLKRGVLTPAEAEQGLKDAISYARGASKLVALAVPRLEETLSELQIAMNGPSSLVN